MAARNNGTIILAGNSLGNPTDIPARALDALRASDLLVFEEHKPARMALKAAGIHRDYIRYNEHSKSDTIDQIQSALKSGQTVTYMSDQGMPNIADPGQELLEMAYGIHAKVVVIPGACSITAALAACPFYEDHFNYRGFLDRDQTARSDQIRQIKTSHCPTVVLETPYRRERILDDLASGLEPSRKVLLALDITRDHEAYLCQPITKLKTLSAKITGKLNFVIVIDGKPS